MTVLKVFSANGGELAVFVAERSSKRLLGLAVLRGLPSRTGLLIADCRSIHTFGMRFPLDVVFVAVGPRCLEVVELHGSVPRRRVVRASRPGVGALELPGGEARRLELAPGLRLRHRPATPRGLQPQDSPDPLWQIPAW